MDVSRVGGNDSAIPSDVKLGATGLEPATPCSPITPDTEHK